MTVGMCRPWNRATCREEHRVTLEAGLRATELLERMRQAASHPVRPALCAAGHSGDQVANAGPSKAKGWERQFWQGERRRSTAQTSMCRHTGGSLRTVKGEKPDRECADADKRSRAKQGSWSPVPSKWYGPSLEPFHSAPSAFRQ